MFTLSEPSFIQMVSLRPGWEGIVVPSKFFGSLAIGRPALFSGPENSDITQWCKEYGIGFILTENTAEDLEKFAENESGLTDLQRACYQVYTEHFSKKPVLDGWKKLLE